MAAVQQERVQQDWEREAIDLKRQGLVSNDIAEAVGKSASTVRKVIARAREAGDLPAEFAVPVPDLVKDPETGRISEVPGQTTVDDFIPPEDDPEYEAPGNEWINAPGEPRDPLEDFRAEAGEAVGPMPEREMDGGVTVEHRLQGTRQEAFNFGPEADIPIGGTLIIKSDKLASGFFGLGDVIHGTFTARVVDVGGKERLQRASEEFRAQPQAHVALITELEVVAPPA